MQNQAMPSKTKQCLANLSGTLTQVPLQDLGRLRFGKPSLMATGRSISSRSQTTFDQTIHREGLLHEIVCADARKSPTFSGSIMPKC